MDPDLIDRIYESAFAPEVWPRVLGELGLLSETVGGSLFVTENNKVTAWASAPFSHEATAKFVRDGWYFRGQITSRMHRARHAGFLTDLDVFTPEELAEEPIYRDLWRTRWSVGWAAGTVIPLPTGVDVGIILPRFTARGPIEHHMVQKLDALRPHLARAAIMSASLQMERARAAGEMLAALGLPALVVNEQGKVLTANSLVEGLAEFVLWRAQDRVALLDRSADQLLRDAMAAIEAPQGGVRSFPVRHLESGRAMVAHVIPIRLSARDIFLRCAAAVVLTPVTAPQAAPVELVQSLFDLTPAEAQVARGLAAGETVDSLAGARDVSANTIRTQVRGVLEKTGCNRQAELVALLSGIKSFPSGEPA